MGMSKIRLLHAETCAVWVGGVSVSCPPTGDQYLSGMNDYMESEFPFATAYMVEESYQTFTELMKGLDELAKRLYGCVSAYYTKVSGKDNAANQAARAKAVFWERMEPHAQEILELAFSEENEEKENTCISCKCGNKTDIYNSVNGVYHIELCCEQCCKNYTDEK